jgi:magnesium chelatase subunit I
MSRGPGDAARAATLGELRAAGWRSRSVKEEIRANLRDRLREGAELFPDIVGYGETVLPQIVNALLARHDFVLLGLRGQAKSRILRSLTRLLDEAVPVIAGSEVNDDPFRPISKYGRELLEERGDLTPIEWIGRDQRYVEKLATPDVTVADLIGDLDPIKAARGGHLLSDELSMHFGLLPRANRGIFAVNELPDLSGKIQVGLFNVMEEGDVQIKGFPVRLPLDIQLVFSANPEDYTARGKIITPLKDRIGSEILTHYPRTLREAEAITRQEAWADRGMPIQVPELVREVIERIAFAAREDGRRIDQRSGVSQRMPITVMEDAVSNAERRALSRGGDRASVRITDVFAALPAVTGKLELEYEGELQGAAAVAEDLIARACAAAFDERFEEEDARPIIEYFEEGGVLRISESAQEDVLVEGFGGVPGLLPLVRSAEEGEAEPGDRVAACELVLEALCAKRRISRSTSGVYTRRRAGAR